MSECFFRTQYFTAEDIEADGILTDECGQIIRDFMDGFVQSFLTDSSSHTTKNAPKRFETLRGKTFVCVSG
ncbi:MAG TPA: hypothetical protein DDX71_03130 [Ruminococcus sp.]|nr:hypothetical protein [Ruminococcus sp.]